MDTRSTLRYETVGSLTELAEAAAFMQRCLDVASANLIYDSWLQAWFVNLECKPVKCNGQSVSVIISSWLTLGWLMAFGRFFMGIAVYYGCSTPASIHEWVNRIWACLTLERSDDILGAHTQVLPCILQCVIITYLCTHCQLSETRDYCGPTENFSTISHLGTAYWGWSSDSKRKQSAPSSVQAVRPIENSAYPSN
jgi:hypothetical protein